jgi:hypothetical protein
MCNTSISYNLHFLVAVIRSRVKLDSALCKKSRAIPTYDSSNELYHPVIFSVDINVSEKYTDIFFRTEDGKIFLRKPVLHLRHYTGSRPILLHFKMTNEKTQYLYRSIFFTFPVACVTTLQPYHGLPYTTMTWQKNKTDKSVRINLL